MMLLVGETFIDRRVPVEYAGVAASDAFWSATDVEYVRRSLGLLSTRTAISGGMPTCAKTLDVVAELYEVPALMMVSMSSAVA